MATKAQSHTRLFNQEYLHGAPYQKGRWSEVATHNNEVIHGFFGKYFFLSNAWRSRVMLNGNIFPSVENAYQSAKFSKEHCKLFMNISPIDAKRISRTMPMIYQHDYWEMIRLSIMHECLVSKFENDTLNIQLIETAPKHLAETNWWGDHYWGCNKDGVGENQLGVLLMQIRNHV